MSAQLIKVSGDVVELPTPVTLKDGQTLVGGPVELVAIALPSETAQMFVNEEGLIKNLAYNPVASGIAHRQIFGDVFVLTETHQWD